VYGQQEGGMMAKILIVDDEPNILKVLGSRLRENGYAVIEAQSGQEAVTKAKQDPPNLAILDISMPGMDGPDVAQALREDKATEDIPIIFLTCLYTKEEEKKEGHLIKNSFFVAKPYNPVELLEIIRRNIK
jgi:DNA-binding response OmpR family regulator